MLTSMHVHFHVLSARSPNSPYTPMQHAVTSLATTSSSFLISDSPILSTSTLPPILTTVMSPAKQQDTAILDALPSTELEAKLQEALQASNATMMAQKELMQGLQAQTVLHSMYLEGVQGQLQAQEEKKLKKRKTRKINMDGRAKILTQDGIVAGVQEWQDSQDKAVEEATVKKNAREKYAAAMEIWKVQETYQKAQNTILKSGWDEDVKKWTERDNTKYECRKPRWTKPKMSAMEKTIHKPMVADFNIEDSSSEEEEDEGEMSVDCDGDD